MNNLKQPNKGDPRKADDIRAMVVSIIRNNVTAGLGLTEKNTPNGKIISLQQQQKRALSVIASSSYPRPFDILSNAAGKIKVHRCWFKNGSKFIKTDSEPEINIATGVLFAVINTAANPITVSLGFDVEFDTDTPELFPVAIYDLTSNGTSATINADLRDCVAVYYE